MFLGLHDFLKIYCSPYFPSCPNSAKQKLSVFHSQNTLQLLLFVLKWSSAVWKKISPLQQKAGVESLERGKSPSFL